MHNPLVETKAIKTKLTAPPLERALVVLAFSPVFRIADDTGAGIAGFQEAVRARFPLVQIEYEEEIQVEFGPVGQVLAPVVRRTPVWRLFDLEKEWRASLTSGSIALETQRSYGGRDDFVERFVQLVKAVEAEFQPAQMSRLGVRYLNVFGPEKMKTLSKFVRREFVAFGCEPYADHLHHSTSVTQFNIPEGTLVLKHGILAPGMQQEFSAAPVQDRRWYLDVDAWCSLSEKFATDAAFSRLDSLTKRTGTMFNWAMTPEFMEAYNARG